MLAKDGAIYAIPDRADAVLRIAPDGADLVGGPLVGKLKWQGAVMAQDGTIVGLPNRAKTVLEIRPGEPKEFRSSG
eukprot:Skav215231  [mRNA]  locus=scaffold341:301636:307111:- [translate_table: standard]